MNPDDLLSLLGPLPGMANAGGGLLGVNTSMSPISSMPGLSAPGGAGAWSRIQGLLPFLSQMGLGGGGTAAPALAAVPNISGPSVARAGAAGSSPFADPRAPSGSPITPALGAGPLPNITSANMPQMSAPPSPPQQPSFLDRLMESVAHVPADGLGGLLSPDDVRGARHRALLDAGLSLLANSHGVNGGNAPSLGQALQQGVSAARQGANDAVDTSVKEKQIGMQMGMQQHVLAARRSIGQFIAQNMTGDRVNDFATLRKAYMMSAAVGDQESMKALSPYLEKDPGIQNREPQAIPAGGKTVLLDPVTHQPMGEIQHTPAPMSDETRAFREEAAAMRQQSIDMRTEQQRAQREARFVAQYETMSKPFAQAAINVQALNENRYGAMHGDPIAQQTALQDFIKLNLPGQMVTAGELHQYASLMGLGDRGTQLLQKLEKGTPLSATQMRLIYQHADGLVKARKKAADYLRTQMQKRGAGYGIDPDAFVDHFGFLSDGDAGAEAPAAGGSSNPLMAP